MLPILEYLIAIVCLYIVGIGFAARLTLGSQRAQLHGAAILLGTAIVIMTLALANLGGIPVSKSRFLLIGLGVISMLLLFLPGMKRASVREGRMSAKGLPGLLLAVLAGFIIMVPAAFRHTTLSYGDAFTYVSIADYVAQHGYFEKALPGLTHPWLTQMKLYQDAGFRMGNQYLLAFFKELFGVPYSMQILPIAASIGHVVFVLAAMQLAAACFGGKRRPTWLAGLMAASSITLSVGNLLTGFLPQAFGLSLLMVLIALLWEMGGETEHVRFVLSGSILTAALIVTYSELLPFLILIGAAIFILNCLQSRRLVWSALLRCLSVLVGAALISNYFLVMAIRAILTQLKVVVGWNVTYSFWNYITIFFSMDAFYPASPWSLKYPILYFCATLFVVVNLAMILSRPKRLGDERESGLRMAAAASPFVLMLCMYLFFAKNPWNPSAIGQTWNVFKLVGYSNFLFLLLWADAADAMLTRLQPIRRTLVLTVFACYLCGTAGFGVLKSEHMTAAMRQYVGNEADPLSEYIRLSETYRDRDVAIRLIMPDGTIKHKQLLCYFLRDHEILTDWSDDDGYVSYYLDPNGSSVVESRETVTLVYQPGAEDAIANMVESKEEMLLTSTEGLYQQEGTEPDTWMWSFEDPTLVFESAVSGTATLHIGFSAASPSEKTETLTVLWNGDTVLEVELPPGAVVPVSLDLEAQDGGTLELKFSGPYRQYGQDARILGFMLKSLSVE